MDKQLRLLFLLVLSTATGCAQSFLAPVLGTRGAPITLGAVKIYGDSMSADPCVGVTNPAQCWDKLATFTSRYGTPTIYAASGDMTNDVSYSSGNFYPNVIPASGVNSTTVFLLGYNDANICLAAHPGSLGCENNMYYGMLNLVAWASIPATSKVRPDSCTQVGAWSGAAVPPTGAVLTSTPGDTLTCTISDTNAKAVYLSWFAADTWTSSASLVVDGGAPTTLNAFGFNGQTIATVNGSSITEFAVRVPVTPGSSHTLVVTVTSAGAFPFCVTWVGAVPKVTNTTGPKVVLGGIVRQYNDNNGTAGADINSLVVRVGNYVKSDGALLYFGYIRQYVNDTSDMSPTDVTLPNGVTCLADTGSPPGLHPNNCGFQHIADAFVGAIP